MPNVQFFEQSFCSDLARSYSPKAALSFPGSADEAHNKNQKQQIGQHGGSECHENCLDDNS
jgi:hypothetical protein